VTTEIMGRRGSMGRICGLFWMVECESGCGYSRIFNEPTPEELAAIEEQEVCPECGSRLIRKVF